MWREQGHAHAVARCANPPTAAVHLLRGPSAEVEEIGAALINPHCRLLTLVGPGGIGKTRLALAAASAAAPRFPDGIYFINLQPVNETEILFTMIADLLGVTLVGQEAPAAQIGRALAGKRILLVLDNFEQIAILCRPTA